jgi:hypothetical protein
MRVVSRLLAAFMIAALVLPAAVTPVLADAQITYMSVYPGSGLVGTEVYLDGRCYNADPGFVYYEIDPDAGEWILVLEDDQWDSFDEVYTDEEETDVAYYEFATDEFEIPESIGGVHRIAVLKSDRGDTIDDDDVDDYLDSSSSYAIEEFTVEPSITLDSDDEGPAGSKVKVKGTGFGYREAITIYFDGDEARTGFRNHYQ